MNSDEHDSNMYTLAYRRGHADGIGEALKAIRYIMELSAKHWVSGSPRWHDGVAGVLEVCTAMLESDTKDIEKLYEELFKHGRNEAGERAMKFDV